VTQPRVESRLQHASLHPEVRPLFTDAELYRVAFPVGHRLFKLSHEAALDAAGLVRLQRNGRITPWWFSYETVRLATAGTGPGYVLPGVVEPLRRAAAIAADFRAFMRSRAAVSWDWKNPMTHVLVVELRREAVGLVGTCSGQAHGTPPDPAGADYDRISFIGGARQIYLPGLGQRDVGVLQHGRI